MYILLAQAVTRGIWELQYSLWFRSYYYHFLMIESWGFLHEISFAEKNLKSGGSRRGRHSFFCATSRFFFCLNNCRFSNGRDNIALCGSKCNNIKINTLALCSFMYAHTIFSRQALSWFIIFLMSWMKFDVMTQNKINYTKEWP